MLWKNRSFMKLFSAYTLSAIGDWFDFMAVTILMSYIWREQPIVIALIPLTYAIPGILFSQWAGIAADRWNKQRLMIATDLLRAILTIFMAFAPDAWTLLSIITVRSITRVFHFPAQQAMTRQLVPTDQLLQATSLNGSAFQLSKILGPLFGASLAAATAPAVCMAVNAACFVISALLLVKIRVPRQNEAVDATDRSNQSLRDAWKEGWAIVLERRTLLASLAFSLIGIAAIQVIDSQFAVLLRDVAPNRPELAGWIITAVGMGGLFTVTWLHRQKQISAYGWLLGGGISLIGLMFASFGMFAGGIHPFWILLMAFIGGAGTGLSTVGSTYILQKESPVHAIGRVSGILESLTSLTMIIAPMIGGFLVQTFSAASTFRWIGLLIGLIGLTGIALQRLIWKPVAVSALEERRL